MSDGIPGDSCEAPFPDPLIDVGGDPWENRVTLADLGLHARATARQYDDTFIVGRPGPGCSRPAILPEEKKK